MSPTRLSKEKLTKDVLAEWQNIINSTAEMFGVSAGLITRVDQSTFEVLLSSDTAGNPYTSGMSSIFPNSGWFCEKTLKSSNVHLIPDAREEAEWKDNLAVTAFGMVSYMGMPITLPDGGVFGTICMIDNKANHHNELHKRMLQLVSRMIELTLKTIHDKNLLDEHEHLFQDLSRIYPICCYCKKVRLNDGQWVSIEKYVHSVTGAVASHGLCPQCESNLRGASRV
ncbi:MAG: GAF domain-containing protein [Verrucomicrobia bacterium]|nr:GAF domain-containing protein [Verrucomicrobiota bacterium]